MENEDQQCLGLFWLELKSHREKLLKDHNTATQAHQQRAIATFFSLITPTHATSKSRATQMGSQDVTELQWQYVVHIGPGHVDHTLLIDK